MIWKSILLLQYWWKDIYIHYIFNAWLETICICFVRHTCTIPSMHNSDEIILRTIYLSSAHYLVLEHKPIQFILIMLSVIMKFFFCLISVFLMFIFGVFKGDGSTVTANKTWWFLMKNRDFGTFTNVFSSHLGGWEIGVLSIDEYVRILGSIREVIAVENF